MAQKKHAVETVKTDLELDENLTWQERAWKIQKVGFGVIFLIPLLALLGVFGDGFLSSKKVKGTSSEVEYEKLYRHEAKMELKIRVHQNIDSVVRVYIPQDYVTKFEIQSVFPEPKDNLIQDDHVQYVFDAKGPVDLVFTLMAQRTGNIEGDIVVNNDKFHLSQFIYP